MPVRAGYSPVISAARVGEQMGAAGYARVKRIPSRASRSMCGVSLKVLPYAPNSRQPRSSIDTTMTLGGGGPAAVALRASAGPATAVRPTAEAPRRTPRREGWRNVVGGIRLSVRRPASGRQHPGE